MIAMLRGNGVLLRRLFELRFLRFLGMISYSLYLWHIVAIQLVRRFSVNPYIDAWLILGLSLLISWLSYLLIERPSSRFRFKERSLLFGSKVVFTVGRNQRLTSTE